MTLQSSSSIPHIETDFATASREKSKKKRLAPLSIRLSTEQREQLKRDAAGMSLNAYAISRLFDKPKRTRRVPTKRDKAIARAIRRLANAGIEGYLLGQIVAQEEGRLMLSHEEEMQLREAYADCYRLRRDLIEAQGLEADNSS